MTIHFTWSYLSCWPAKVKAIDSSIFLTAHLCFSLQRLAPEHSKLYTGFCFLALVSAWRWHSRRSVFLTPVFSLSQHWKCSSPEHWMNQAHFNLSYSHRKFSWSFQTKMRACVQSTHLSDLSLASSSSSSCICLDIVPIIVLQTCSEKIRQTPLTPSPCTKVKKSSKFSHWWTSVASTTRDSVSLFSSVSLAISWAWNAYSNFTSCNLQIFQKFQHELRWSIRPTNMTCNIVLTAEQRTHISFVSVTFSKSSLRISSL